MVSINPCWWSARPCVTTVRVTTLLTQSQVTRDWRTPDETTGYHQEFFPVAGKIKEVELMMAPWTECHLAHCRLAHSWRWLATYQQQSRTAELHIEGSCKDFECCNECLQQIVLCMLLVMPHSSLSYKLISRLKISCQLQGIHLGHISCQDLIFCSGMHLTVVQDADRVSHLLVQQHYNHLKQGPEGLAALTRLCVAREGNNWLHDLKSRSTKHRGLGK